MERRGFLKLAGLLGALPTYTWARDVGEPKGLIEDVGDYYRIMIPDGGALRRESFNKPVLILFGRDAVMDNCLVNGFVNVVAVGTGVISHCAFDCSKMRFTEPVPCVTLTGGTRFVIRDCWMSSPPMG